MCKHRQAKNKNTSIQFALLKCQTVTKNNNSPTTIIYVNLYEKYKVHLKKYQCLASS